MISRILVLLVLAFLGSGAAYYFLRETPQTQITRLRKQAKDYLERNEKLEVAEQLVDQVLELIPHSAFDLVTKASIRERRGSVKDLQEALRIYEQILTSNDPGVLGVAFLKARVCRQLGLITEATSTVLSVVDLYPFAALLELGDTALSGLAPGEALQYFGKSKEAATTKLDAARADEGIANAFLLSRVLSTSASVAPQGASAEDAAQAMAAHIASLEESARGALLQSLSFIKSDDVPTSNEDANRRLMWATLVVDRLAAIPGASRTTLTDGLVLVDGRRGDYGILNKEAPGLLIRLGGLRLLALRTERPADPGVAAAVEKTAESNFVRGLQLSVPEARTAVETLAAESGDGLPQSTRPEGKPVSKTVSAANTYVQNLIAATRAHLVSGHFGRILNDNSPVSLSTRIDDVMAAGHPGVTGLFTLLQGFAHWKSGDPVKGEQLIDAYLAGLGEDVRSRGVVEVAEQALTLFPQEPVCFRVLDKFGANGGTAFDFVGRRISVLLSARTRAPLAAEARRRLDQLQERLKTEAQSVAECLGASKIIHAVAGKGSALELMKQAALRFPTDPHVQRVYADLQLKHGVDRAFAAEARQAALREALCTYVYLFARAPGDSQEVIRRSVDTLRMLDEARHADALQDALQRLYSGATARSLEFLATSLRLFMLGQVGPALENCMSIGDAESEQFRPFISFLRGSCQTHLAGKVQIDLASANSDATRQDLQTRFKSHVAKAMEHFRREPDSIECRFELANLEFASLESKEDVPDDLFRRIQVISDSEGHDHAGYFLLSRACRHRFEYRYRQRTVKNSELLRWVVREQKALRAAIRKSPEFNPAYLALAETFLVTDRVDRLDGQSGNRQLFTPSFDKAISILKAAPSPDDTVYSKLAQCYELSRRYALAAPYLERLVAMRATGDTFHRLLSAYLRSENPALDLVLAREVTPQLEAAIPPSDRERLPGYRALQKKFVALPESHGQRHLFQATRLEQSLALAGTESARKRARDAMLSEYMKSVEAFESRGLPVPLMVLNNLAWYLSEEADAELKARAIDLADRARKMAPDIAAAPDAHDTYAWTLHRNDRNSEAEVVLREVLSVVDSPSYRYRLAKVLLALRKFDEALREVRSAREFPRPFPESDAASALEHEIREARRLAIGE